MSYWKLGKRWAGITKRGKRFVVDSLTKAKQKVGKKGKTSKRTGSTKTGKKGKTVSKGKSGFSLGMGWKGLLVGTLSLTGIKYLARRFLGAYGAYADGLSMVGASFLPIGGTKAMRPVGIMELGSEFINDLVSPNGVATLGGLGGLGGNSNGGCEF